MDFKKYLFKKIEPDNTVWNFREGDMVQHKAHGFTGIVTKQKHNKTIVEVFNQGTRKPIMKIAVKPSLLDMVKTKEALQSITPSTMNKMEAVMSYGNTRDKYKSTAFRNYVYLPFYYWKRRLKEVKKQFVSRIPELLIRKKYACQKHWVVGKVCPECENKWFQESLVRKLPTKLIAQNQQKILNRKPKFFVGQDLIVKGVGKPFIPVRIEKVVVVGDLDVQVYYHDKDKNTFLEKDLTETL